MANGSMMTGWTAAALAALLGAACAGTSASEGDRRPIAAPPKPGPEVATPLAPAELLDTTPVAPTGRTIRVAANGRLQAALDEAKPGDVVEVERGASFTGPFVLRAKAASRGGSPWVVVRTSAESELPRPGERATPSNAGAMPKLVADGTEPALKTEAGASFYRFVGIELAVAPGVKTNYGVVVFGTGTQERLADVPHDLVLDRCYVHGNPTGDVSRGVALNSARTAIVDSTIAEIHGVGFDTQAICGWNGPGPFKIVNNKLEGAGENVLFGGSDSKNADLVPSDIEFRRNECSKPLSWYSKDPSFAPLVDRPEKHWTVKNLFELKSARRVLVDGNVFENCWVDGQQAFAIVFTPRNQGGNAPWSVVEDVTFTNNLVRNSAGGVNILGADNKHESDRTARLLIRNNLFDGIGDARLGANGRFVMLTNGGAHIVIDRNTALQTGNPITFGVGDLLTGFAFTNNVVNRGKFGVVGTGTAEGTPTLEHFSPGAVFEGNVVVGGPSAKYPPRNQFPAALGGSAPEGAGCDHAAIERATGRRLDRRP